MKIDAWICIATMILAGIDTTAVAQSATEKPQQLKIDPVKTSMSDGMTKDQADEILKELRAIHQLLERQQQVVTQPQAPTSDQVQMTVSPGWYSLGRDDAPITLVEFSDYQCPFCRKFQAEAYVELKKNYIDTGKVRFVSRDLPLDFHANAPSAAMAARCAGEQGKFWEMHDLVMVNGADLSSTSLLKYGKQLNLQMTSFGVCLSEGKYTSAIHKDVADAGSLGIRGTPGFVIGRTAKDQIQGVRIIGAVPYSVFDAAIKNQLSATP
jgi:protein-disulfide isomerase